ncbi:4-alpha-glucanotransferase [Shimia sp.]|uniref:4-alpha-glucanotransferase n=1 Tax=Shimia sp. TaxID=1954381 RepID=UPI003298FA59
MTDWISDLCHHVGIGAEYGGFDGQTIAVSQDTRLAVLRALGYNVSTEGDAQNQLNFLRNKDAQRPAPPEVIIPAGQSTIVPVSRHVDWVVEAETSQTVLASGTSDQSIALPKLPLGIHRLVLRSGADEWVTWILAHPTKSTTLADHSGHDRAWGVTAPLYGLTNGNNAEIGTYPYLGEYAAAMAGHGADFLGINPIHAMGQTRPENVISPYSPSHREFLNTWHVAAPNASRRLRSPDQSAPGLINYPAALTANDKALATEYAQFLDLPETATDKRDFVSFCQTKGKALDDYALFEVLASQFGPDWRNWPAEYRNRHDKTLARFLPEHTNDLSFHKWAQWLAARQLADAQIQAIDGGMRIGIYLDLAVGPRLGGAETWVEGTSLVTGATLGAPPDPLGPSGQSWGLAPQSPRLCREQGYAGFSRLLQAVMRHAGMIRIDHILGLMRSFWIPDGGTEGAYVSYPVDALLAVVAIESARNRTIVIGEDLGLVPEGLREKLAVYGIYGLDVLQYMRNDAGGFTDTAKARTKAICAFATHDTPTINGFFAAEDARLQMQFGAMTPDSFEQIQTDRQKAHNSLGDVSPICAIHKRLANANSELVAVQLDDVAERKEQQNLPGTIDEYPNWQQAVTFSSNDIRNSPAFAKLGLEMRAEGRTNTDKIGEGP